MLLIDKMLKNSFSMRSTHMIEHKLSYYDYALAKLNDTIIQNDYDLNINALIFRLF